MVHLPHLPPGPQHSNGSQHPASGLLCTSRLELKTENTLSYIQVLNLHWDRDPDDTSRRRSFRLVWHDLLWA